MKYSIHVNDAKSFIDLMHKCLDRKKEKKVDPKSHEIETWYSFINTENEILFVHDQEQWKKCCIELTPNEDNDIVNVVFYYFESTEKEDRSPMDKGILYGRFTELILSHFYDEIKKIVVS